MTGVGVGPPVKCLASLIGRIPWNGALTIQHEGLTPQLLVRMLEGSVAQTLSKLLQTVIVPSLYIFIGIGSSKKTEYKIKLQYDPIV